MSKPALCRVFLLNDEHTPMEFVVHVLQRYFELNPEEARLRMLRIHNEGIAECGVYPQAEAKKKAAGVLAFAREHKHPLQCVTEKSAPG
jgi:ATP-dependent Clp protease adaptor protein ClpS